MHGERTWRDRLQAKWATTVHAARAASASFFDLYRWGRAPRPAAAAPTALPGSMKPRLKGSQAGYCSIATTTSSIAGIDEAPRPAAAAPAATAAALPDEPQQDGAGASPAWKEAELATTAPPPPPRPAAAAAAAAALPDEGRQAGACDHIVYIGPDNSLAPLTQSN
ncbi:hypothetical protein PF002_g28123 [Phytophthora fragariae]|uniref:Uncharacterized protein n=1 Tax=Phytophthora fragariae TaxID=53985 RepID=A0A6A3W4X0_9STRA|nr:hypothetical protein PF007_g26976 [Phytophthora fragariae]KAE9178247.1 hypothetical protein PF002_g28123 [Phytophthora fragariae]